MALLRLLAAVAEVLVGLIGVALFICVLAAVIIAAAH